MPLLRGGCSARRILLSSTRGSSVLLGSGTPRTKNDVRGTRSSLGASAEAQASPWTGIPEGRQRTSHPAAPRLALQSHLAAFYPSLRPPTPSVPRASSPSPRPFAATTGRHRLSTAAPTFSLFPGLASQQWRIPAVDRPIDGPGLVSIRFSGGGIYFFWQLGVAKYLGEQYDLSRAALSGTSCGALCATLAACGVSPERALQSAYQLSLDNDLWERPLGLAGIWGRLILEWLEELLPEEAGDLCRERLSVMITELPTLRGTAVSDFKDKADVIEANMASIHIPFFLDWQLARECRGKLCVDGSLPNLLFQKDSELQAINSGDSGDIFITHTMDENLRETGFLKLRDYEEVVAMMDLGYAFAERMDKQGAFTALRSQATG